MPYYPSLHLNLPFSSSRLLARRVLLFSVGKGIWNTQKAERRENAGLNNWPVAGSQSTYSESDYTQARACCHA